MDNLRAQRTQIHDYEWDAWKSRCKIDTNAQYVQQREVAKQYPTYFSESIEEED